MRWCGGVVVPIRDTIRAGDAVSRVDTIDQTGRGRFGGMCVGVMVCVRRGLWRGMGQNIAQPPFAQDTRSSSGCQTKRTRALYIIYMHAHNDKIYAPVDFATCRYSLWRKFDSVLIDLRLWFVRSVLSCASAARRGLLQTRNKHETIVNGLNYDASLKYSSSCPVSIRYDHEFATWRTNTHHDTRYHHETSLCNPAIIYCI